MFRRLPWVKMTGVCEITSVSANEQKRTGPVVVVATEHDTPDGPVQSVAIFGRVSDALAAAVALRSEFDAGPRLAVHGGEDEGSATIRAVRLMAIGHPGQVLLSRAAADLAIDGLAPDWHLHDLGVHRLRDLGRPEHVFEVRDPQA